jgi:hypothetical protein
LPESSTDLENAMADAVQEPDYDHLLRANLERVFNERDVPKRNAALDELYVADPILYEPTAIVRGRAAISEVVTKLLEQFGPAFSFAPSGAAVGHHGIAVLHWQSSPPGPNAVTGMDAAEVVDGRIARLWVLLNPPGT